MAYPAFIFLNLKYETLHLAPIYKYTNVQAEKYEIWRWFRFSNLWLLWDWGSWLLMRLGSGYSLGAGGQRVDRGAACACRVECLWLLWLLGTLGLPARWIFILTIVIKVDCPWLLWLLSTLVLPADCNHFHPHYCQLWWSKLTASGSFDCWAQLCCPLTATILILTIFIKVDCLWLLWLLRTLTIRVCCPLPTVTNLIFTAIIILLILLTVDCCSSDC